MKHISPLPILLLVLFSAFTLAGFSQQVIGSFPYMDGGFEGQTSGALANTLSTTAWTRQSVTGASSSIIATSPRTGLKYATITNVASVSRGLQSPQTATAANGPAASTSYTIQYFIKNPSIGTYTESINTNGTTNTAYGTAVTVAANASWTKRTVTQTSSATAVSTAGILVTARSASAVTFDIDDVVLYAGAVDNTAANSPGTVTVNGATTTTLNVSWVAASGGVDGGGYVVVRYASSPGANDDPNVNGIYAVGNTVTGGVSGTVAYVGTGISFTDNLPLLANTTYYYKVYTVDKAFNYSAETTGNASTLAYSNPTTSSISPTFANAGASSFTITVNGTNFLNGFSTVTWNGSNRTTTFVSATQLTATIPSGDITTQGTANVGVTTTGAVSASGTQTFTINAAGGAAQTINFPTFLGKTYGDASFDPGANATSGLAVSYASDNNAVASISGINIVINGPGTANITASQGGNGFYAPAPDVVQEISVLAKPLTVTGAVAENKIYDGGTAATITGYSIVETLVGADVVTVSGGGTFASSSVGTGIAVTAALSLGGAQAAKYSLTQPTGLTANIIAPILAWEFNTKAGNEVTVASTTTDANLNTSTISRGAGITATALPNGFSSSTYTVSGTLANAVTNNQYMQFTVNPKPGYQTSLSSLDANLRRSATGPNAYQWKYSLDGFATAGVDIGSPVSYTLTTSAGDPQTQINLSGISALQNIQTVSTVTFRLYPYGATNTGGTFALGLPTTPVNDLAIGGTTSVAPTPDIIISNAHPAIGTVDQGTVDHIIGEFFVDINTANAYLTGVSVTTAGTYQSADITNIKFWVNNLNTLVGATQIGTTQAAVGNGGTASVSGLATTIPSGSNRYIIVTASVAGNAVPGRTIRLASTAFANIQFASGNKTGTNPVASSNDQTITQLDPTIAISNASLTASSINQNSTNQMVHSIKLDVTVTSATVTSVTMEPSGTYQSTDLVPNSLKFWINTTNNLTGATQLGTSQAIVNAGDPVSVSGLSQVLNINSTYYLILTADVAFNAVAGRTLLVGSTNFSNLIFASSNKTGTDPVAGGNTRTFAAVVPSITISGTATTSTTIGAPSTNNVIYQFSVAPTVNSAQLSLMTLPLTGTYINTNISASGMKLWYNSTNTFGTATQIKTANIVNTGGNLLFTGLTQTVTISTTGFFWVTADISASATAGKTIKVNTVSNSAFTFTQGTVSGTPPSGGTFTFLPQPTITEVILPQYMQGNTATNSTRIPYVFRLKIGNLSPSATYRYYNSVVNSSDGTTGTGAGNIVYPLASGYIPGAQSLSTAGSYNTFLTNASGEYTGWFMVEPTGNARFTPGASINMRIQLNDGSTGTTVSSRVTTTSTITVINFATSAGAANGTGIRGTSSGTAKNIVVLYDNVSGSGRPLSAAAIESDGFTQAPANASTEEE